MLEMDQNLEQRDLGKNTGIEIPIRETEGRENKKNAASAIRHSLKQAIWGDIREPTVEKSIDSTFTFYFFFF